MTITPTPSSSCATGIARTWFESIAKDCGIADILAQLQERFGVTRGVLPNFGRSNSEPTNQLGLRLDVGSRGLHRGEGPAHTPTWHLRLHASRRHRYGLHPEIQRAGVVKMSSVNELGLREATDICERGNHGCSVPTTPAAAPPAFNHANLSQPF